MSVERVSDGTQSHGQVTHHRFSCAALSTHTKAETIPRTASTPQDRVKMVRTLLFSCEGVDDVVLYDAQGACLLTAAVRKGDTAVCGAGLVGRAGLCCRRRTRSQRPTYPSTSLQALTTQHPGWSVSALAYPSSSLQALTTQHPGRGGAGRSERLRHK